MILITFFLLADLSRSTGFIDIPTAPDYERPSTFSVGLVYSLPIYTDDPDLTDSIGPDPNDFDAVIKYSFGRGEVGLAMFTTNTFSANAKFLLVRERDAVPAVFIGVDDITYTKYVSTVGNGPDVGFAEEKNYYLSGGGRPPEMMSGYLAVQKSIPPYFKFVFGLGRGRFVGYGARSHIFNSDIIVVGDNYEIDEHSPWAFGIFTGGSIRFPFGLELMAEMDGRDANAGMRFHHKYFSMTFAVTKLEHFFNSGPPFSPRLTFGIEANNRFMTEGPRFGSIECVIQDINTKELLHNATIEIRELNKKYTATGGTFMLSLATGNYTLLVSKPDYVDYTAKLSIKAGVKSKLVFNLKKTEDAMRLEIAAKEREQTIKAYLEQGKVYYFENKLDPAKVALEMVLSLDPGNSEAKDLLAQIEPRRQELISVYTNEARARTTANDFAKAIEAWQKVLNLDSNNVTARTAVSELQARIAAAKPPEPKKPTEPAKPKITQAEIEALYKKGVSLFTSEKYDEALKIFKQVLAYDPKHAGAKDYKDRTEARIRILKGGG